MSKGLVPTGGSPAGFVFVFVIGIIIVAFTVTPPTNPWIQFIVYAGFVILIAAVCILIHYMSQSLSGKFLLGTIAAALCAAAFLYHAVRNEITGTAVYSTFSKHSTSEAVTRESSPKKFREATNFFWGGTMACTAFGAITFAFYRKLEE